MRSRVCKRDGWRNRAGDCLYQHGRRKTQGKLYTFGSSGFLEVDEDATETGEEGVLLATVDVRAGDWVWTRLDELARAVSVTMAVKARGGDVD